MPDFSEPTFNRPEGFFLVESLFVASREAAVCAITAWKQSKLASATAKPNLAREFEDLGQSCSDASEALYKVAANAGTLYQKYVRAEHDLACANSDGDCEHRIKSEPPDSSRRMQSD